MKTAMQKFIEDNFYLNEENEYLIKFEENTDYWADIKIALNREKEQIQKAFSDGQETPINHPTLPHYSREEYYNDNYNQNK
jgi:hypothetical protein